MFVQIYELVKKKKKLTEKLWNVVRGELGGWTTGW